MGRGNRPRKFAKNVVVEEIGWGNEIILSKINRGNRLEKLWLEIQIGQKGEKIYSKKS